jgi:antitoxin ParD1/3/4
LRFALETTMNVKNTVTLSDEDLRYAEELVEDGRYLSVDEVIRDGLARIRREDQATDDPVAGMADEIRRRMELPRDQWIPLEGDTMFDEVRALIRERKAAKQNGV